MAKKSQNILWKVVKISGLPIVPERKKFTVNILINHVMYELEKELGRGVNFKYRILKGDCDMTLDFLHMKI